MENKTQILLIGIKDVAPFQDIRDVLLNYCDTAQEALELFVEHEFDILICNYQLPDENAVNLNESIQTFLNFYPKHSEKDTKLLAIINNEEEKKHCEENNLSYYPANSDIIPLISKLIDIAYTSTTQKKILLPIDFDELFNRVDNNRRFIKTIVEKFFGNSDERVNEIRTLIKKKSFQEAKNSAHKIKGVLANLSMVAAKQTATEIEKFALNNDTDNSLKLTDKLENQIEEAQIYYNNNSHLFSEQ